MVIILNGHDKQGKGIAYQAMTQVIPGVMYAWTDCATTMMEWYGIDTKEESENMKSCIFEVTKALERIDVPYNECISYIADVNNGLVDEKNIYIECNEPANIEKIRDFCEKSEINFVSVYYISEEYNAFDKCDSHYFDYDYIIDTNTTISEIKKICTDIVGEM